MEELLAMVLQGLVEFLLEVLSSGWDWGAKPKARRSVSWIYFGWFIVGCIVAGLSVLIFKYTYIQSPVWRVINVVLAPLVSAWVAQVIAKHRQKLDSTVEPRFHFWRSFWFVFGVVMIRFAYAMRV